MVTMSRPLMAPACSEHERIGTPFTWTVQAPHCPTPQPNFVPVMPSVSRSTQRSGVSGSTSTLTFLPLILSANIAGLRPLMGNHLPESDPAQAFGLFPSLFGRQWD